MRRPFVATVAVLALVSTACGSDDGDTAVLGISVEREPAATASPDGRDAATSRPSPVPASPDPSPTADTNTDPEPGASDVPSSPAPPPPPPPPPSEPSPEPEPDPTPAPYVLGDATSNGFSRWQANTGDPETCCWSELDGSPPQDRDADHGQRAVVGRLVDPVPAADGEPEPWQRQVRDVTCQAALLAPSDRGMQARGTVEVVIRYDDAVLVTASYPVDVTLAAGARHELPRPDPGTVDAEDGRTVSCHVSFASS